MRNLYSTRRQPAIPSSGGATSPDYILRGIRSTQDYEYEQVMRHINSDMAPAINTVLLMPPRDISELSSNRVKGLCGPIGWEENVRRYVPDPVMKALTARFGNA